MSVDPLYMFFLTVSSIHLDSRRTERKKWNRFVVLEIIKKQSTFVVCVIQLIIHTDADLSHLCENTTAVNILLATFYPTRTFL